MQTVTYAITGLLLLTWDGRHSHIKTRLPDRTINVTFPDGYDHLGSVDSPICEQLEAQLRSEGFEFAMANYFATATDGTCEERRNIGLVEPEALAS
jgi:hypothetical protein